MTSPIRRRLCQLRDDESGQTLVYIAIGFMTFVAASTVAVDLGTFMTARTQAQSAADAGALAGAAALVRDSWTNRSSTGPAVQGAISTARRTPVVGASPSVLPTDVTFQNDPAGRASRVQVKVYRTAARQTALPTLFGPLLGVPTVDVAASATAEALPSNAMTCVKPFSIPDKWQENSDSQARATGTWTAAAQFDVTDTAGRPLANPDVYFPANDARYTGYTVARDKGSRLTLRAGTGPQVMSSAYVPWKMPANAGYRDNVASCNTSIVHWGDSIAVQTGNLAGLTAQGVQDLIDEDPDARWDVRCKCVVDSPYGANSPRVFPIPLYDPAYYAKGRLLGRPADYRVANFLGFFADSLEGDSVSGYITDIIGVTDTTAGPAPASAFPKTIRLVQ